MTHQQISEYIFVLITVEISNKTKKAFHWRFMLVLRLSHQ